MFLNTRQVILLILTGFLPAQSLIATGTALGAFKNSHSKSQDLCMRCLRGDGDLADPYGDMLDLDKKVVEKDINDTLYSLVSISAAQATNTGLVRKVPTRNKIKHWDPWMQREFGDMGAELGENDKWQQELRDTLEQKRGMRFPLCGPLWRAAQSPPIPNPFTLTQPQPLTTGFAIWSGRSDKDIQKEIKKNLANKALKLPEAVSMIIRTVYLDRTHTFKEIKKENELACLEFKKWMNEQKNKSKKDPLPMVKMEVVKVSANAA